MGRAARTPIGGRARLRLTALTLAGLASAGCAPSLRGRSIADPLDGPNRIVAIGRARDIVYALTGNHELRAWDLRSRLKTGPRLPKRAQVIGIARDGTIALSASDTVVDAWEPASGRLIATHRFEHGTAGAPGVSSSTAYIVANLAPVVWPGNTAGAAPPRDEFVSWNFASGRIEVLREGACHALGLSNDGTRTLCYPSWQDRPSGIAALAPTLAPEWAPPEQAADPLPCLKCGPRIRDPGYDGLSTWLSADGLNVYLAYRRSTGGTEWRLDRWIPDPTGKTDGRIERLAVSHEPLADRVLAVSRDGRTVLTDPGERPPVLRHAPGYEGIPLLAPPVTAAVFSEDDRLLVTGHGDGRLRLWDAVSGRFEAITPD